MSLKKASGGLGHCVRMFAPPPPSDVRGPVAMLVTRWDRDTTRLDKEFYRCHLFYIRFFLVKGYI
jgi:hypothetical protein